MHEVLVNRLGGLSLPRKIVVRLTDRSDMTLDVYRRRKTTTQQQQISLSRCFLVAVFIDVVSSTISVLSGRLAGDNERLCAMEPQFTIEKIFASGGAQTRGR